jgi:hypothetical protein
VTTTRTGCATFDTIARWWLGDLDDAAAAACEEHLFACDACANESERIGDVVRGLRAWIPPVISHAQRDRFEAEGKRIRLNPVEAGVDSRARFDRELDLLVHVLRGDLSRADSVDVEIGWPAVHHSLLFEHVPFDRDAGEVLIACQKHFRESPMPGDPRFTVFATENGVRRRVGEYFIEHEWM